MSTIKDFTDAEQWAVNTTLKERWPNQIIDTEYANGEIKLYQHDRELTYALLFFGRLIQQVLSLSKLVNELIVANSITKAFNNTVLVN
ncbi:MAG: hypothetical protein GQ572_08200 [Gammaproteobacteria bacterium]|jgi:hypothetical protein|nr:hypothetical protein [Gammaproteobacteria bacterium]